MRYFTETTVSNTAQPKTLRVVGAIAATLLFPMLLPGPPVVAGDWLQFRGSRSNGVVVGEHLPRTWDRAKNIAWKAELPGRGLSGPLVIGSRVVLTASSGVRQEHLHVLCFDRASGAKRWERRFWATGMTFCHPKTCVAAPTPASDGERIFAFYSSNDLICLDLDGNLLWLRGLTHDYPHSSNSVGMTSSPLMIDGTLVVQVENESNSFAAGLDPVTGLNRWKIPRPAKANWVSPVAIAGPKGEASVLVLQSTQLTGHDPATGNELWRYDVGGASIPSTTVAGNRLFVPGGGLTALDVNSPGGEPQPAWQSKLLKVSTASPIVYDKRVYTISGSILICGDVANGNVVWRARLKGPFSGTPIVADGLLYAFNEDGVGQIADLNDEGRTIAECALEETILCSPAAAGGALFVRSDRHLWKIGSGD